MSSHSLRHSDLSVYIFQADVAKMKGQPKTKWNLYGLWTHSSCPVVQYISEESQRSRGEDFGLELLGQCTSNRQLVRELRPRVRPKHWLVVKNDGVRLEAVLDQGNGLSSVCCTIKELPKESPFSLYTAVPSRRQRQRSPERRPIVAAPDRHLPQIQNERVSKRHLIIPVDNNQPLQWYTSARGEHVLKNIYTSCISKFPPPNVIQMTRDAADHNIQLSIQHNNNTFNVHFPNNFPQDSARILCATVVSGNRKLPEQVKYVEDIVRIIKSYCRCYKCRR